MKRFFSVVLCVLLVIGCCPLTVFAAGACGCGNAPVIFIDGINACDLIRDAGTQNQKVAFPFTADDVMEVVDNNGDAIWDLLDGNFSAGNERAIVAMLEDVRMNPDGTSLYDVSADWAYPTRYGHKNGERFRFCFDWRLDPFEIAAQLRDFVEYVKDMTGHDTVHMIGFSMGTIILQTYFTLYGYEGVESVVWYSGAYRGLEMVGQLFTNRYYVDAGALAAYADEALPTDESVTRLLVSVLDGLTGIGLTKGALRFTNRILQKLIASGAMDEVLLSTFGSMPGIWSFIDDNYYEAAKENLFAGKETQYAALIEKIDRYHYNVQMHADEIMENARAAAGKIGIISKYGRHMVPVTECSDMQADGVIDVYHTSGFATAAKIGETLPADAGNKYLSADRIIDASMARYPDQTWFVKNAEHSSTPEYIQRLIRWIQFSDHQVTVWENPEFPQFASYDPVTDTTAPLTGPTAGKTVFQRLREFFRYLIESLKILFNKRFGR